MSSTAALMMISRRELIISEVKKQDLTSSNPEKAELPVVLKRLDSQPENIANLRYETGLFVHMCW